MGYDPNYYTCISMHCINKYGINILTVIISKWWNYGLTLIFITTRGDFYSIDTQINIF